MDELIQNIYKQEMTPGDYRKLSETIYNYSGISLPETKRSLVEGRIRKRIKFLNLESYQDYLKYLFSKEGLDKELVPLIDVITTNKTDFFRENMHFEFLVESALPMIIDHKNKTFKMKDLNFWSAGCSTGEEPYTLAIILNEFLKNYPEYRFSILATDISTDVLETAKMGIYENEKVEVISEALKKKYLLRSKNPEKQIVRFVPEIRSQIQFTRLNLIDEKYVLPEKMDVIFCRNVIIYFDKQTQEKVIRNLADNLNKGGYLFIGHSETTMGMNLPLERVASTVYRKI